MEKQILGRISSEESMGLVDGPGIRYVIFMQGCSLRCKYCHNPETWCKRGGYQMTPQELIAKVKRYSSYFGEEGGVTFSGGEPLLQPDFLKECLRLCKEQGIHTVLDTAGVGEGDYQEILKLVDLVILDVKAVGEKDYKNLTGRDIKYFNEFVEACKKEGTKLWLRQVIVPGLNDNEESVKKLKEFASTLPSLEKIELLPYKNIGKQKYQNMGMRYILEGTPDMNENECKRLEKFLY